MLLLQTRQATILGLNFRPVIYLPFLTKSKQLERASYHLISMKVPTNECARRSLAKKR